MNKENWLLNLEAAMIDMAMWKQQYIKKVKEENPDISKRELAKRIRKAQSSKFRGEYDHLILDHPDNPYSD